MLHVRRSGRAESSALIVRVMWGGQFHSQLRPFRGQALVLGPFERRLCARGEPSRREALEGGSPVDRSLAVRHKIGVGLGKMATPEKSLRGERRRMPRLEHEMAAAINP